MDNPYQLPPCAVCGGLPAMWQEWNGGYYLIHYCNPRQGMTRTPVYRMPDQACRHWTLYTSHQHAARPRPPRSRFSSIRLKASIDHE